METRNTGPLLKPESDNNFLSVIAVSKGHDGMDDYFHKCSAYNLYSELLGLEEINNCSIDTIYNKKINLYTCSF
jgi:hypothetical protein